MTTGPTEPAHTDTATVSLSIDALHSSLSDPALASMTLLNEIAQRFPDAISFAAGRPYEGLFRVDDIPKWLGVFCRHLARDRGCTEDEIRRTVLQYGPTKGIIQDLVARNLAVDEAIQVSPESIVVTVGCQEALFLTLLALRRDQRDAVLAEQPTYVGLSGAARLAGMPVVHVPSSADGIDAVDLARAVGEARSHGLRPRACYVIPDFSNPLGATLSTRARHRLLDAAADLDILLLEDNPYGVFSGAAERPPTLKSLDVHHRVVYLGSFAKTALAGARVGYAVADQPVIDDQGRHQGVLADHLATAKSMVTVNTSPVAQAIVGGKLLRHGCSLVAANARETAVYQRNRTLVLDGLARRFPRRAGAPDVTWNTPGGGFFLVLNVPFRTDDTLLAHSAQQHGLLWIPMHHFYADGKPTRQLRLSYSLLEPESIEEGLDRLAGLVHEQCGR